MLESGDGGALGVILNRPTQHALRDVSFAADAALTAPFADNALWMGGDVGDGSVIVLARGGAAVDGATEVARGVRCCAIKDAAAAVRAGRAAPRDFRFFARYAGWGPGQLQREVKAGVWCAAHPIHSQHHGTREGKRKRWRKEG